MGNYHIESIAAHGSGKKDAVIHFTDGLNIIQGYSDTGKTCVLKCIDYIFGSSEKPFDTNTGYTYVTMKVVTPHGEISFTRYVGKNQIQVVSTVPGIDTDTYDIKYRSNQKKPVINSVWFKLLGIEGEPMIVSNGGP